ncbi:MAG: tRNA pseudouridine55 synthase [Halieaceae bacterium]|jgi:tRNA pseudouridine55 synthase
MGRSKRGRPVNGMLILDKPAGESSNRSLQNVKSLYYAAKAGHTGSLDPLATGILPICFGEATKFSGFLLDADKAYKSTFILGVSTDSGDADGKEIATASAASVSREQIDVALQNFRGEISQVPSMFSALKHEGQRLYKLARQGKVVERKARAVTIYQYDVLEFRPGEQAELDVYVSCSKGTYIRSLAEDLGAALGCGAHVSKLRRVQAGPFTEDMMVGIETLQGLRDSEEFRAMDALLAPVDVALGHLPLIKVGEASGFYVRQGQPVLVPNLPTSGLVRLELEAGEFLGIGEILDDGRVAPKRLVSTL